MRANIQKHLRIWTGFFFAAISLGCLHMSDVGLRSLDPPSSSEIIVGTASWYGGCFHGRSTANGETYNMYGMTAAHRDLPLGSVVRVTNLSNQRRLVVRINDRGPYIPGRVLDLSYAAARRLGMVQRGTAKVKIEVLTETELARGS